MPRKRGRTYFSIDVGNLLDRTSFTRLAVFGSDHATVCTLTQLFDEDVLGVYDKGRVDCCERMSLHPGSRLEMIWRKRRRGLLQSRYKLRPSGSERSERL